ncbi:tigger transposable element-derived protein 1-like [Condylostylus longicornis]|uniref:tigger transposable element-derived protein 1-like n=1 Tax=Condylostylus longicornis TaxID=2530218 RepID=UPI00244E41A0|nr:tigger transposable element-derived protein 1-like [Condylostylus longicornis]
MLIVDNASSHTKELDHPNVKIVFLPPNCTSLIQPLDQGIISTLKAYYIRLSFEKIFNRLESDGNATLLQTWKEFSILDCVTTVALACKELKRNTLNRCWKSLLPQMVNTENVGSTLEDEYNRIISVASNLEGDGFVDMNIQDIRELFEEKTLDEEELIALLNISNFDQNENFSFIAPKLSLADVQKGIALANDLENHFVNKDSSAVRCGKFKRDLRSCLGPYREVLAQLQSDFVAASSDEEITSDEDFQANMKKINTKSRVIFDDSDDSN